MEEGSVQPTSLMDDIEIPVEIDPGIIEEPKDNRLQYIIIGLIIICALGIVYLNSDDKVSTRSEKVVEYMSVEKFNMVDGVIESITYPNISIEVLEDYIQEYYVKNMTPSGFVYNGTYFVNDNLGGEFIHFRFFKPTNDVIYFAVQTENHDPRMYLDYNMLNIEKDNIRHVYNSYNPNTRFNCYFWMSEKKLFIVYSTRDIMGFEELKNNVIDFFPPTEEIFDH